MRRSALANLARIASSQRPWALAALTVLTVAGCGVVGRTSIKTVQLAVQGKPDVQPTATQVAANRFPQIKVTGPAGGAILVLGNVDGERRAWYSADHSIVYLQDGLVVGTYGGKPELQGMLITTDSPFRALHQVANGTTVQRRYDVMPGYRFGMEVTGTLNAVGHEKVEILGQPRDLLHVRERLRGNGWNRINDYWVDPSNGFIWKSIQAIAPDTSLEIIQLKPYSQDVHRQ